MSFDFDRLILMSKLFLSPDKRHYMTKINLAKELGDLAGWSDDSREIDTDQFAYEQMLELLANLEEEYGFQSKSDILRKIVHEMSESQVTNYLFKCGVIPEMFAHDSSNEKIYAELCEILVSAFFRKRGEDARVLDQRGGSADVLSSVGDKKVVLDAKAFRLSRTALNPKDYKIEAINEWTANHDAEYSGLVGPLNQFPGSRSRLYTEAVRYDVTLLSYGHLAYLLKPELEKESIDPIWELGDKISNKYDLDDVDGDIYWDELEQTMLNIHDDIGMFEETIESNRRGLEEQSKQQIEYWESKKDELRELTKEELVEELIKSKKIDKKIDRIQNKDHNLH